MKKENINHLRVTVSLIPPEGIYIKGESDVANFSDMAELTADKNILLHSFSGPLYYDFYLQKLKADVFLEGRISLGIKLECSRCLQDYAFPVDCKIKITYHPEKSADETGQEYSLINDEIDAYFYAGDILDLEILITDQIILSLPIKTLCQIDCLGLCGECGQNLNEQKCNCN